MFSNEHESETKVILVDFGNICRICLSESDDLVLTTENVPSFNTVNQFFQTVCSIQVTQNDVLPESVCSNCYNNVCNIALFINLCQESDEALRESYLKTLTQAKSYYVDATNTQVSEKESSDLRSKSETNLNSGNVIHDHEYSVSLKQNEEVDETHKCQDITPNPDLNQHKTPPSLKSKGKGKTKRETWSDRLSRAKMKLMKDIEYTAEKQFETELMKEIKKHFPQVKTLDKCELYCGICSKNVIFKSKILFIKHQVVKHKRKLTEIHVEELSSMQTGNKFHCIDCNNKPFLSLELFAKHRRQTHENHLANENNTLGCIFCTRPFSNSTLLILHYKSAHRCQKSSLETLLEEFELSKFYCYECDPKRQFLNSRNLLRHLKSKHGVDEDFPCVVCNITFSTKSALDSHATAEHMIEAVPNKLPLKKRDYTENTKDKHVENVQEASDVKEIFVCFDCEEPCYFLTDIYLIAHKFTVHNKKLNEISLTEIHKIISDSHVFCRGDTDELEQVESVLRAIVLKKYVCSICKPSYAFQYSAQYVDHQNTYHKRSLHKLTKSELLPVYCNNKGDKIFKEDKVQKSGTSDLLDANDKVWKCEESGCGSSFVKKASLQKHYKSKHDIDIKICGLTCPVEDCEKSFYTNKQLIQHGLSVHEQYLVDFDANFKDKILLESTTEDNRERNFECDICGKKYLAKNGLRAHIRRHVSPNLVKEQSAICSYCGQILKNGTSLKSHIEQIHERTFVSCPICKKKINLKYLRKHYKIHRAELEAKTGIQSENPNIFLCNDCGKVLKTKYGFEAHEKMHKNIRDIVCDICSAAFTSKAGLKMHKNIHAGDARRYYECDLCDKKFNGKQTLNRHILTHTGERNYICEICSKCFYTLQELRRHTGVHNTDMKYQCENCDRLFRDTTSYRIHVMRHKNIRPYECKYCEKRYVVRHKLHLHMDTRHHIKTVERKGKWKDPTNYIPLDDLLKM